MSRVLYGPVKNPHPLLASYPPNFFKEGICYRWAESLIALIKAAASIIPTTLALRYNILDIGCVFDSNDKHKHLLLVSNLPNY